VLREDIAVAYLRGELSEGEQEAFEQHYFQCAECFERLQVVRELGGLLRLEGAAVPQPAALRRQPNPGPAVGWLAWAAGAAFVAVGAAMVIRNVRPLDPGAPVPSTAASPSAVSPTAAPPATLPTPERPPLDFLARVEPPPYAPLVVRGGEPGDDAFARAMEAYVRGDYAGAAVGLRVAVREDPESAEAHFYLGVCELLAGRPEAALGPLRRAAAGDPGFAEAAQYYMAKAHLARGDVAAARNALRVVASGDGDHKEQAARILLQLGAEP
jgi:TolA-binding protein